MKSIRKRLLLSLLAGLIASITIVGAIVYMGSDDELNELLTHNLTRMALVLEGQVFPEAHQKIPQEADTGEPEESYVIQIWDGNGTLVRSSWPSIQLPLQMQEGLGQVRQSHRLWQTYTHKVGALGYVQIAQPQEIVETMVGESAMSAIVPFLVLFVLLGVGGWLAVGHSLSPLKQLSEKISGWDVSKMRPLEKADVPIEVRPIVDALNDVLVKLKSAIALQQQFTADSAHELRTPLAAIRLQLDNLVRATSEEDRSGAVKRLSAGIDRCGHLAAQLLTASRSMSTVVPAPKKEIDLAELVRTILASYVAVATSKDITMAFDSEGECRLLGDEEGLRALIGNLVDNAVRYTNDRGSVTARLTSRPHIIVLEVSDDGVGIPVIEQPKIFRRFYRIPGTNQTGSGLGLSIVRSVAEAHRATVEIISSPPNVGTTFRVVFPTLTYD